MNDSYYLGDVPIGSAIVSRTRPHLVGSSRWGLRWHHDSTSHWTKSIHIDGEWWYNSGEWWLLMVNDGIIVVNDGYWWWMMV